MCTQLALKTTLPLTASRLNLTAASHVHIVEPQWNPMVEEQAAARVHRIGQERDVSIIRYIVKDSIEEVGTPQT
jgi:SWI/SNF-related matrix-associated actin-dependent regulator of chromatin subfamily A3